jgi:hypothetical protein
MRSSLNRTCIDRMGIGLSRLFAAVCESCTSWVGTSLLFAAA